MAQKENCETCGAKGKETTSMTLQAVGDIYDVVAKPVIDTVFTAYDSKATYDWWVCTEIRGASPSMLANSIDTRKVDGDLLEMFSDIYARGYRAGERRSEQKKEAT